MDDEFGGKSKQDEKRFKDLASKNKFSVRMPYQRYFEDIKRLAVLCGTSNEEHVLNDLTGNRRIIPIQINSIDEKIYSEVDKDELFIELYYLFKENPKGWFLNKEDIERLNEVSLNAQQVAPELELPLKYYEKSDEHDYSSKFVSSSEIRSTIEQRSGIRISQQKLSIALKKIGYIAAEKRISGIKLRGFWVIEKFNSIKDFETNNYKSNENDIKELPF
jgi:predicted P-loop ATPase